MQQDGLSEQILVLKCQRHDESAFRELVNLWEHRLYYYLRRFVGDKHFLWDILQETWLTVFKEIPKLQDVRTFPAWLYRITHNKAVDWLRKENKYVQMTDNQIDAIVENDITVPTVKEQAELVHGLLEKLSLAHREVLTLYFLEDFSIREIAQIIGVSDGTVKSRLYYAKRNLYQTSKGDNDVRA